MLSLIIALAFLAYMGVSGYFGIVIADRVAVSAYDFTRRVVTYVLPAVIVPPVLAIAIMATV